MKRLGLSALFVVLGTQIASAGGYVGIGVGSEAKLDGGMSQFSGSGRSLRLVLGQRFGRLGVEGIGIGYDLVTPSASYTFRTLGVALKYSLPLSDGFEVFGRGGVQRSWLQSDAANADASGDGLIYGGGVEYRIEAGIGASIWADYNRTSAKLSQNNGSVDGAENTFTLGVSLAI